MRERTKASRARDGYEKRVVVCAADVHRILQPKLDNLVQECIWGIMLDSRSNVLSVEEIARGAVDNVAVHPREMFRPAIEVAAVALVMVHNHPSGDPSPSTDDVALTRRMARVGCLIGIPLLDHIVVAKTSFFSFAESRPISLASTSTIDLD